MPGTLTLQSWPILSDRYFMRQRASLVDGNIYPTDADAVPFRAASLLFTGDAGSPSVPVEIWLNGVLYASITANAANAFSFSVVLAKGRNQIQAKLADGQLIGNTIFLNAYSLHTLLEAFAGQFTELRGYLDQGQQDKFIDDITDWDSNATTIASSELRRFFGQYVSAHKIPSHTREQYRTFLKRIFTAHQFSPTIRGLDELCLAYLGTIPTFRMLKNTFFAQTVGANGSAAPNGIKFNAKIGDLNTLQWTTTEVWMYRRWFRITPNEKDDLAASSKYWVYVDGDVDANQDLTLKFLKINITSLDYPLRQEIARTTVVAQAEIRTDTTGKKTGTKNTLYVETDRIPTVLTSATGSVFGVLPATIISGTGWVSLGVQVLAATVGAVTVVYKFKTNPRILARVTTDATVITAIEFNSRIRSMSGADGTTSGTWGFESQSRVNEFIIILPNYHLMSASLQADFDTVCDEIMPSHKLKLIGDSVIVPSPEYPLPISAELGATTRANIPTIPSGSAELGSTTRGSEGTEIPEDTGEFFAELGGTGRERP
jgi:hypothetical protein